MSSVFHKAMVVFAWFITCTLYAWPQSVTSSLAARCQTQCRSTWGAERGDTVECLDKFKVAVHVWKGLWFVKRKQWSVISVIWKCSQWVFTSVISVSQMGDLLLYLYLSMSCAPDCKSSTQKQIVQKCFLYNMVDEQQNQHSCLICYAGDENL